MTSAVSEAFLGRWTVIDADFVNEKILKKWLPSTMDFRPDGEALAMVGLSDLRMECTGDPADPLHLRRRPQIT